MLETILVTASLVAALALAWALLFVASRLSPPGEETDEQWQDRQW